VLSNEPETPTTRRIKLALDGVPFSYRAGQAASLAAGGASTPYSMASSPAETGRHGWLEFLVKVDGSTRFGAQADRLQSETPVTLTGPVGSFTLEGIASEAPLLFVAGGTGIAPLRSMIREALDFGRRGSIALVYSSRTPDEFAYLRELRALESKGRLTLTLTLTGDSKEWSHARGRTTALHFAELLQPATVAFICGPPAMVTDVAAALASLGLPPDRVITESW
jgi:ferredoxin-NADP reductase